VTIDQEKCMEYGPECEEKCIAACKKVHCLQPLSIEETYKKLQQAA
jgi:hypothetical protein